MEKKKIILTKGEIAELSQEEVYKRFEKLLHKINIIVKEIKNYYLQLI